MIEIKVKKVHETNKKIKMLFSWNFQSQVQYFVVILMWVKSIIYSVVFRVGSVGSVSASRTVGREFASRPGHTKDHHKNGTNCLPAWHAMR